jgi:hypothetical protein
MAVVRQSPTKSRAAPKRRGRRATTPMTVPIGVYQARQFAAFVSSCRAFDRCKKTRMAM